MSKKREVDVDSELVKKAKAMEHKAAQRNKGKTAIQDIGIELAAASQISLDLYPDDHRATPNLILRAAIFRALAKRKRETSTPLTKKLSKSQRPLKDVKKGRNVPARPHVNELEVACLDGGRYRIFFTGELLDQADRDVYELLIYLCKTQPLGTTCVFSSNNFLKLIDRPTSKANYEWLEEAFKRLLKATILINQFDADGIEQKLFGGHLIDQLVKDSDTKKWSVKLGDKLYDLYTQGARFTYYPVEHRLSLKKHPLASWLQGFFCTHITPIPFSLQALIDYSGSENESLSSFKQRVTVACKKLQELGIFLSWGWQGRGDSSKLFVVPKLNKSQVAYINNKAKKASTPSGTP